MKSEAAHESASALFTNTRAFSEGLRCAQSSADHSPSGKAAGAVGCAGEQRLKQKPHVRLTSTALESTGIASAPVFMTLPHSFLPSLCLQPLEREGSESDLLNCPQCCLPIQPWEQFLSISMNCRMLPPGCPHSLPTCAEAQLNLPPPPTASSSRGQAPALRRSTCGWRCDRLLARTPLLFLSACTRCLSCFLGR